MFEPPTNVGVHHLSDPHIQSMQQEGYKGGPILNDDRFVIPAKHEAENIGNTIGYLLGKGILPDQIVVLVNGPKEIDGKPDETADRARAVSPDVQVIHQNDLLQTLIAGITISDYLKREYNIDPKRLRGKGAALFTATLALHAAGISDSVRIFLLDADIKNPSEVDPIGRLLIGADRFPKSVRMVKLASLLRDNAGIHAFLFTLGGHYAQIGALRWPLCGQVIVYWGDLKYMRLSSGYAVEMAMMMDLIVRAQGDPSVFGEVEIGAPLHDKRNSDHVHVRMYAEIMNFVDQVLIHSNGLPSLTRVQMREFNARESIRIWTPAKHMGRGRNTPELRTPDVLLPSITELYD